MLSIKPTIPVDLRIVEAEEAVFFPHFDAKVIGAGKDIAVEGAVFG